MKHNERALLQERVKTLVLRHAFEAILGRLAALAGANAVQELLKLENRIVAAGRNLGEMPTEIAFSTMVATEGALTTICGAFDVVHQGLEAALTSEPAPLAA